MLRRQVKICLSFGWRRGYGRDGGGDEGRAIDLNDMTKGELEGNWSMRDLL